MTSPRDLFRAIDENDIATVSSLIEQGVNVNDVDYGNLPLVHAVRMNRIEIMTMLLEAGADVDAGSLVEESACFAAIDDDNFDALKLLVDRGARIDRSGLLQAASRLADDQRIVLMLLDGGAPLEHLTGQQMINLVENSLSIAVLKRLVALNVDFNAIRGVKKRTLCHCLTLCNADVEELVRVMFDAGIAIDDADIDGATPLHFTMRHWILCALVELGADIDRQDKHGGTALHRACQSWIMGLGGSSDESFVPLLLALGANVHLLNKRGQSASHLAATSRHRQRSFLAACCAAGGDLDQSDNDGNTVRTIASFENFQLPTADEIDDARRQIAKARLDLVRQRASQICLGLQSLRINALELCEIMMHSFGALGALISFHQWWAIATTVKHFHDRHEKKNEIH